MRWCYACGDTIKGGGLLLERFGTLRNYCTGCGEAVPAGARSVAVDRSEAASDAQEKEVETVTLTVIPRKAAELAASWIWLDLKRIRDQDI